MSAIAVCAAAGSAAVLLPATGNTQSLGMQVSEFRLANGLQVVVIPDRRTPVVTHMVWYHVGSADETAGKSGLAHFLEHLMFKGTEKIRRAASPKSLPPSADRRTHSPRRITPLTSSA